MIYVTGASGYLGSHILLQDPSCVAVPRGGYAVCANQVVIHCAAVVPKTEAEATDAKAAATSMQLVRTLLSYQPAFVVFPSTRETMDAYAAGKMAAEETLCRSYYSIPRWNGAVRVIRFPGLFGPPRRSGLAYTAARAILRGESFKPEHPLPRWVGMHVMEAAALCILAAKQKTAGLTIARNQMFEDFLDWVRA